MTSFTDLNFTDKVRTIMVVLFVLIVLVALGGWLIFDRDPAKLQTIIMTVMGGVAIGEASNVGKRATYKSEAVGVEIPEK